MSLRKLLLVNNKTLTEEEKLNLAQFLSNYDTMKNQLITAKTDLNIATANNIILSEIIHKYRCCVSDMAADMVTGNIYTAEYYIHKYEQKWGIIDGGDINE